MVVPFHWADHEEGFLYYPRKGKVVGEYVRKWASPDRVKWRKYVISKTLKEFGTHADCQEIFRQADSAGSFDDSDRTMTPSPQQKRIGSIGSNQALKKSPRLA